jgi:hypothetical protein
MSERERQAIEATFGAFERGGRHDFAAGRLFAFVRCGGRRGGAFLLLWRILVVIVERRRVHRYTSLLGNAMHVCCYCYYRVVPLPHHAPFRAESPLFLQPSINKKFVNRDQQSYTYINIYIYIYITQSYNTHITHTQPNIS